MIKVAQKFELISINNTVGVDEAGRGAWAGPVVAAAVALLPDSKIIGINDSKKLSPKKRQALYEEICNNHKYGIGVASTEEIGQLNILQATFLAMHRAISELNTKAQMFLIDGSINPNLGVNSMAIIKGDCKFANIAAASIIAKVTRDNIMTALHAIHPEYKWCTNFGYGTADHIASLREHGLCPHHRHTFDIAKYCITKTDEE